MNIVESLEKLWKLCLDFFINPKKLIEKDFELLKDGYKLLVQKKHEKDIIDLIEYILKFPEEMLINNSRETMMKYFQKLLFTTRLFLMKSLYDPNITIFKPNDIISLNEKFLIICELLNFNSKFEIGFSNIDEKLNFDLDFNENGLIGINLSCINFKKNRSFKKNILWNVPIFCVLFSSFHDNNEILNRNQSFLKHMLPECYINQLSYKLNGNTNEIIKHINYELEVMKKVVFPEYKIFIICETIIKELTSQEIDYLKSFIKVLISMQFCIFIPISFLESKPQIILNNMDNFKEFIFDWKKDKMTLFPSGLTFTSNVEELSFLIRTYQEKELSTSSLNLIMKKTIPIFGSNISIISSSNIENIYSLYDLKNSLNNFDRLFISTIIVIFKELSRHKYDLNQIISEIPF